MEKRQFNLNNVDELDIHQFAQLILKESDAKLDSVKSFPDETT